MKAVLIISHGSRSKKTVDEIHSLVDGLTKKASDYIFEYAFLELAAPNINEGIDNSIERGATEVLVLLNFLNAGRHVDVDIPEIVGRSRQKHPNVPIHISSPVGQHPGITNLFLEMINEAYANKNV